MAGRLHGLPSHCQYARIIGKEYELEHSTIEGHSGRTPVVVGDQTLIGLPAYVVEHDALIGWDGDCHHVRSLLKSTEVRVQFWALAQSRSDCSHWAFVLERFETTNAATTSGVSTGIIELCALSSYWSF